MAGHDIVEKIMFDQKQWSELWQKHDFFYRYNNYLQVVVSTKDQDAHLKWCLLSLLIAIPTTDQSTVRAGKVESQVRQLVSKLEFVEGIASAHPYTKGIEHVIYCKDEGQLRDVAAGQISADVLNQTITDIQGIEGSCTAYTTTFYIGLGLKPKRTFNFSTSIRSCYHY